MRVKPLPEPPDDLAIVEDARSALPLVPGTETDCCARLGDRLDLPRDDARTWLTFLRGLGLVEEVEAGFVRTRDDPDLPRSFREGIFGATEALDALGDDPLTADALFERIEGHVPEWERHKRPGAWRGEWRERTRRLLDWLVLLGLAHRTPEGYVRE